MTARASQTGYTLIELLVSVGIAALLLTGLQQLLGVGIDTLDMVEQRTELARRARFAMSRMVDAVQHSDRLLIPLANNPATPFDENIREQTVPASPPQTGSLLATAVLALTIGPAQDMDANGIADADNDGDGLIDEDLPADAHNDGKAGVRDFDDDGNGTKDFTFSPAGDDDESNDFKQSEDPFNGIDDDGDGSIDEDSGADMNGDLAPGVAGVDDDGDGNVDEGSVNDDDEDGAVDEDWFDPVVFYLNGNRLIERRAVPWDANLDSTLSGRDFVESDIAENITLLRIERLPLSGGQQLVDITLQVSDGNAETIVLNTRVRLGGAR
ncbi:MAG: prepilin-type N-terminal cleavage/methylation domain-containing protein [Woeseia sp.]